MTITSLDEWPSNKVMIVGISYYYNSNSNYAKNNASFPDNLYHFPTK